VSLPRDIGVFKQSAFLQWEKDANLI